MKKIVLPVIHCVYILPIISVFTLSSCATARGRFLIGGAAGAATFAPTAALLSPNRESTWLNALVFGLTGALVGAFGGVLTLHDPSPESADFRRSNHPDTLRTRERDASFKAHGQPTEFLEGRVIPPVIESFTQSGLLTEDGVLHEPHQAYRISRPAELLPVPQKAQADVKTKEKNHE